MTTSMTTLRTRRLAAALLALALGVTAAGRLQAAPITFEFTGAVIFSDFGTIGVGSAVTGSYTFDRDLADQDPDGQVGLYGPVDLTITFADSAFADGSSIVTSTATFRIANNVGTRVVDEYILSLFFTAPDTVTGSFAGLEWNFGGLFRGDDTGAAFADDSLPLTPPDLASLPGDQSIVRFGQQTARIDVRFTLTSLLAVPDTLTLTAAKDSFLRSGAADRNEGANPGLRIRASGHNRVVVGFDQGAIEAFLAANTLTTAMLVLTIAENADNWGKNNDRTVDAHPLLTDFAEGDGQNAGVPGSASTRGSGPGVTWHCAEDADIANQATDCDPRWDGGAFGPATAAPVLHVNGLSGEVRWDVTADVQAGVSAWLIKKTDERQPGRVSYHSKEGAEAAGDPDLAPRLVLEGQEALPCGDSGSKCVFVTSSVHQGDFGGLAGGDAICNELAAGAGLPGTYKAWLSIEGADNSAAKRLTPATVPYKLVTGETVANDFTDLVSCEGNLPVVCLQNPIDTTEGGVGVPSGAVGEVWTGTRPDGSSAVAGRTCLGWTAGGLNNGQRGELASVLNGWTERFVGPCERDARLYCFQQ
jgi:hypothetical protein